uniref:NADH-ubiquinone oxidoreductase chain 6 n=1 Tax=Palaemon gravieri TaxID=1428691 RepID=A0A0U2KUD6_9EUCA|nr:NADH dehydrogenase subunit 6 [Palaemon gravieri]ALT55347.1 NADH dehydrogenase subunit 6 [Palaemon gravieri]ANF05055.1 NADH dehydrogenase subunit 6 [Palaemon gravieri]
MYSLIFSSLMLTSMAICFTLLTHPLSMGLVLVAQTILICFSVGVLSTMSWFPYILFLIFLGATLVLFIYVASLASNEPFKVTPTLMILGLFPIIFTPILIFSETLILPNKEALQTFSFSTPMETSSISFVLNNIYNPTAANLTAVVILYLLLTLVVVVKLSSSFIGPLRLS